MKVISDKLINNISILLLNLKIDHIINVLHQHILKTFQMGLINFHLVSSLFPFLHRFVFELQLLIHYRYLMVHGLELSELKLYLLVNYFIQFGFGSRVIDEVYTYFEIL